MMTTELGQAMQSVLELQKSWTAHSTPEMQRRGELIRNEIPALLRTFAEGRQFSVEGSSGAGSNNRVPWVRIFRSEMSPSPQEGWYAVFLFAADGSAVFLSLNQGTTDWSSGRGKRKDREALAVRSERARIILTQSGMGLEGLSSDIDLVDPYLGRSYERGNVFAIRYESGAIPANDAIIADLSRILDFLEFLNAGWSEISGSQLASELPTELDEVDEQQASQAGARQQSTASIWLYAPGRGAQHWEEFYRDGIMAIGWDDLGDLTQYADQDSIIDKLIDLYKPKSRPLNDSRACFDLVHSIRPGDRVIAKKGRSMIVGYGVVTGDYQYRPDRPYYKHVRSVRWDGRGSWTGEELFLPLKTLTDFTLYPKTVSQIDNILGIDQEQPPVPRPAALPPYTVESALQGVVFDREEFEDVLRIWQNKNNLILQGPPGVGKTFLARRLAYALIGFELPSRVGMVQFHQSYAYEDFIQGYRPAPNGFERRDGIFVRFCNRAKADQDSRYVFIIDEINRGNVSKIFGELLMLIERDYRGSQHSVALTYSSKDDEQFYVPKNVYLLGMMNTADRSLALVDYALRRRFSFESLEPLFDQPAFLRFLETGGTDSSLARTLSQRLSELNKEIIEDANLGKGFCVGHSYFCRQGDAISVEDYIDVIRNEILPLLEEYWVDDRDRVEKWRDELLAPI